MLSKIFNNFNDDEKSIYDQLCEVEDDNNEIYPMYKDLHLYVKDRYPS